MWSISSTSRSTRPPVTSCARVATRSSAAVFAVWPGEAAGWCSAGPGHILLTGQPLSVDEQEVMLPGGVVRLFDVRGVRADQLVSFTHRDVTDRAAQAREIAESREHFRLLAENASEMVFQTGADHLLSWVSPSVTRVLGVAAGAVAGAWPAGVHPPDDLADVMGTQQELINSGELSGRVEYRLRDRGRPVALDECARSGAARR